MNEVTDLLATYFKGTKRRNAESMNDYLTRKNEAYMRASQALRRVQPYYEGGQKPSSSVSGRRSYGGGSNWSWYGSWGTTADTDNVSRQVAQDLEAPGEVSPGDDESTTEASGGTAWQAYNSRWRTPAMEADGLDGVDGHGTIHGMVLEPTGTGLPPLRRLHTRTSQ